jgi:hypothetical protein
VLEPDEGKLSSPVLRGLGASNGARPLGWKERVAYDENVYLAALAKHNSPLRAATKIAL